MKYLIKEFDFNNEAIFINFFKILKIFLAT